MFQKAKMKGFFGRHRFLGVPFYVIAQFGVVSFVCLSKLADAGKNSKRVRGGGTEPIVITVHTPYGGDESTLTTGTEEIIPDPKSLQEVYIGRPRGQESLAEKTNSYVQRSTSIANLGQPVNVTKPLNKILKGKSDYRPPTISIAPQVAERLMPEVPGEANPVNTYIFDDLAGTYAIQDKNSPDKMFTELMWKEHQKLENERALRNEVQELYNSITQNEVDNTVRENAILRKRLEATVKLLAKKKKEKFRQKLILDRLHEVEKKKTDDTARKIDAYLQDGTLHDDLLGLNKNIRKGQRNALSTYEGPLSPEEQMYTKKLMEETGKRNRYVGDYNEGHGGENLSDLGSRNDATTDDGADGSSQPNGYGTNDVTSGGEEQDGGEGSFDERTSFDGGSGFDKSGDGSQAIARKASVRTKKKVAKKGSKKALMLILPLVLILLIAGAAGGYFFWKQKQEEGEGAKAEEGEAAKPADGGEGSKAADGESSKGDGKTDGASTGTGEESEKK